MLDLWIVQILAAVSLIAIVGGFLLVRARGPLSGGREGVVAEGHPALWTEVAWIGGSLVASLWPIGVLAAPAFAYHWPALPDFPFSGPIQLIGFLVSLAGGSLFFAASRALGRHMTPAIQVQEGHQLVQEGPYRYIRHPVYTAIITAGTGLSILYLSPALALVTLLLVGLAVYRAHLEEELLGSPQAFGHAYSEYVARTGRFLPRIRSTR